MLRALNKNQILILNEISQSSGETITQVLDRISKRRKMAVSTLKLNAGILRDLGLIDFGNNSHFQLAELTQFGRVILVLLPQSNGITTNFKDSSNGSENMGSKLI